MTAGQSNMMCVFNLLLSENLYQSITRSIISKNMSRVYTSFRPYFRSCCTRFKSVICYSRYKHTYLLTKIIIYSISRIQYLMCLLIKKHILYILQFIYFKNFKENVVLRFFDFLLWKKYSSHASDLKNNKVS